jgi:hypothetical protein
MARDDEVVLECSEFLLARIKSMIIYTTHEELVVPEDAQPFPEFIGMLSYAGDA